MEFVIITGMSGAGRSCAADAFEDMGFYCVDNMPPALMLNFADICQNAAQKIEKVAFVMDLRGGGLFHDLSNELDMLEKNGIDFKLLFLDASDNVLIKRFKETRRRHPLDETASSIIDAIATERKVLTPVKERADYIVDTSGLTLGQLKDRIVTVFSEENISAEITVNVVSFGFKYGTPMDADMVFDVRCFPNPHYIDALRGHTGLDKPVSDYVFSFEATNKFCDMLNEMVEFLLPNFIKEGKSSLVIAIGCTGGKHRSVAIAEKLGAFIKSCGYNTVISHRHIAVK